NTLAKQKYEQKAIRFLVGLALITISNLIPISGQRSDALQTVDHRTLLREQEEASQRQREADNISAIASILSTIEHRQAEDDQRRADSEPKNLAERIWWSQTASNWTLAFFAAVAAGIAAKSLRAIEKEVEATGKAAKA